MSELLARVKTSGQSELELAKHEQRDPRVGACYQVSPRSSTNHFVRFVCGLQFERDDLILVARIDMIPDIIKHYHVEHVKHLGAGETHRRVCAI